MKIKLTPEISYVLGLWKYARTREGIGVEGHDGLRTAFLAGAIKAGLAKPNQVQLKDEKAFFYHTAYRAFFDETLAREDVAYSHHNEYAAAFLAGLFDSMGGVEGGKVFLSRWDGRDEMVLLRLNFRGLKSERKLWISPSESFLKFISAWRGVDKTDWAEADLKTDRGKWMREKMVEKRLAEEAEKPKRRRRTYPTPPPK